MPEKKRFALNVSVFVIATKGTRVLLLRRSNTGWKDGFYSLPAGAHDGGETLSQAAARELLEETGLIAAPADLHLAHLLHCRSGDSGSEWLGAFFMAQRWEGQETLKEPHKHDDLRWFEIGQLPENIIPYTRQGLLAALDHQPFSTFGW